MYVATYLSNAIWFQLIGMMVKAHLVSMKQDLVESQDRVAERARIVYTVLETVFPQVSIPAINSVRSCYSNTWLPLLCFG